MKIDKIGNMSGLSLIDFFKDKQLPTTAEDFAYAIRETDNPLVKMDIWTAAFGDFMGMALYKIPGIAMEVADAASSPEFYAKEGIK